MIRVTAPSRLHFGPFSLPPRHSGPHFWPDVDGQPTVPARHFGGVGLMIEKPGVEVAVEFADVMEARGPLAERARKYLDYACIASECYRAVRATVADGAREHVGLGTGTQLGLALGHAVAHLVGEADELSHTDLADFLGRGERSALGIHGFLTGGFLVEAGRRDEAIAPLVVRHDFPADWAVVLLIPRALQGAHAGSEARAFRHLAEHVPDLGKTEALARLALLGMLPALVERDLIAFGEALYDFNRRAGELFKPWQGGLYSHPTVEALVHAARAAAPRCGVGQTSWGPTVFVFTAAGDADEVIERLARDYPSAPHEVIVTRASSAGAVVTAE